MYGYLSILFSAIVIFLFAATLSVILSNSPWIPICHIYTQIITDLDGAKEGEPTVEGELANEFAVFDRWFTSVPASTKPNRIYIHSATSHGGSVKWVRGGARWIGGSGSGVGRSVGRRWSGAEEVRWKIGGPVALDLLAPLKYPLKNTHEILTLCYRAPVGCIFGTVFSLLDAVFAKYQRYKRSRNSIYDAVLAVSLVPSSPSLMHQAEFGTGGLFG